MAIILSSCVSARNYFDDIMSPTEEKISAEMTKKLDDYDPAFFDAVDTEQMRMFSLGEYYIFQSILRGPTGLGSNFYYYLLVKKDFSKDIYFMSLSREIKNIWKKGNSLFIDLLDFCTESYFDGEYSYCDSCVFISFHTELSTSSFSLDTISSEKQYLSWGDIKSWKSLLHHEKKSHPARAGWLLSFLQLSRLVRLRRSSRWRVFRGSNRIRDIHDASESVHRSCCTWSAEESQGCRAFFSFLFSSVRTCVLGVA